MFLMVTKCIKISIPDAAFEYARMKLNKNIKYTGIIEQCPLCHNTTELVKCKSMRWSYMRCQVCLLARNTKLWNQLRQGYIIYKKLPI